MAVEDRRPDVRSVFTSLAATIEDDDALIYVGCGKGRPRV